jgi:hypothetical protein
VSDRLDLRASDIDRERAATQLREACAEGRLSVDELGARLDAAYSARTLRELDAVVADLPRMTAPARVARTRPRWPGNRPFTESFVVPESRSEMLDVVYTTLAPLLNTYGFTITSRDERAVVFEQDERPGWTIAVAVLVFPFGLLALTHRRKRRVVLSFADSGSGTEVAVYGSAPLSVRRAFAELHD